MVAVILTWLLEGKDNLFPCLLFIKVMINLASHVWVSKLYHKVCFANTLYIICITTPSVHKQRCIISIMMIVCGGSFKSIVEVSVGKRNFGWLLSVGKARSSRSNSWRRAVFQISLYKTYDNNIVLLIALTPTEKITFLQPHQMVQVSQKRRLPFQNTAKSVF